MLKLTIIAVCGVLMINYCGQVWSAGGVDMDRVDKIGEFCRIQERATDNDMTDWRNDIKPKPRIVKCLDACVGEKMGMLVNNRLNVDTIMNFISTEIPDQNTISNFKAIVDECKSITDRDRCELSAKILDCISNGARRRGMKELF